MPEHIIPDYVRVAIVPIANPETCPVMLRLAAALLHPEEGRLIALAVSLGEAETEAENIAEIEEMVDAFQQEGYPVELMTQRATSVARGILDVAREEVADLIILGVRQHRRGEVVLGTIAENVIATALCDVLLYRAGQNAEFERVVVPVDGSLPARVAARVALLLADHAGKPIETMYVQSSYVSRWLGLARIEQSLADIPGAQRIKRTLVTANNPASGILARINEDDLVVVGASQMSELEHWLFGHISRPLLEHAPCPVILTSRRPVQEGINGRIRQYLRSLTPTLTRVEQDELMLTAEEMATPKLDFFMLIIVSALLASFGLLQSSPAVVIGAMLVAPMMQPLIAFATGLTVGQLDLIRRSFFTNAAGILLVLILAYIAGTFVSNLPPTSEMVARGSPSLVDIGVALASGLAGAYATARKDIPAALAGVAIAAALVPPLCTVGLALAMHQPDLALGAMLLFVTNIVCISLAGWAVFFWLGMRPAMLEMSRRRQYISLLLVVLLILPALVFVLSLSRQTSDAQIISQRLEVILAPAEVVDVRLSPTEPRQVTVTIQADEPVTPDTVQALQEDLANLLNEPIELEVVFLQVITPPEA